jgi:hypothetical protein
MRVPMLSFASSRLASGSSRCNEAGLSWFFRWIACGILSRGATPYSQGLQWAARTGHGKRGEPSWLTSPSRRMAFVHTGKSNEMARRRLNV